MSASANPRRRIYLMRHGAVSYFNADGTPVVPETVPLNATGRMQADAAGALFAAHGVAFDRVITSSLNRTLETAQRVLAQLDQRDSPVPTPIQIPALDEIRGGRLRDIPPAQLEQSFIAVLQGTTSLDTRFLGGESVAEMLARVTPEIDALRADPTWQTALLVLHGGVNRGVLSYLLSGTHLMLGGLEQTPACINVIDVGAEPRDVIVRATNLSPTDWLQHEVRTSTMEVLFVQYAQYARYVASAAQA
ncbi:MAG: histidine phosphatase family protein [Burkholderiales bacterium]